MIISCLLAKRKGSFKRSLLKKKKLRVLSLSDWNVKSSERERVKDVSHKQVKIIKISGESEKNNHRYGLVNESEDMITMCSCYRPVVK